MKLALLFSRVLSKKRSDFFLLGFVIAGSVLCSWGRGEDGQLGHGDAEDRLLPTLVSVLSSPGIVSIACGADHTTAYSEDELQVYSWGW